jgi:hypothetical protein
LDDLEASSPIDGSWAPQNWGITPDPIIAFNGNNFVIIAYGLYPNVEDTRIESQQNVRFQARHSGLIDTNHAAIRALSEDVFRLMFLPVPMVGTADGEYTSSIAALSIYRFTISGYFSTTDDMVEIKPPDSLPNSDIILLPFSRTANTLTLGGTIFISQD